jgi:hypothetical protein
VLQPDGFESPCCGVVDGLAVVTISPVFSHFACMSRSTSVCACPLPCYVMATITSADSTCRLCTIFNAERCVISFVSINI